MAVKVTVKGIPELRHKLNQLSQEMRGKALLQALVAGALVVQNSAKVRAPVKTGNLRRSIHIEPRAAPQGAEVTVGTNVEYAHYIEFGTRRMPARPYLRPALDDNRTAIETAVRSALMAIIAKVAGA